MTADTVGRLDDILAAIAEARSFVHGQSFEGFVANAMLRRAVERTVEIISEASRHIPADLKERHPAIPWKAVAGVGNILRHGYQRVEDREIWRVVTRDLDPLERAVRAMRVSLSDGET